AAARGAAGRRPVPVSHGCPGGGGRGGRAAGRRAGASPGPRDVARAGLRASRGPGADSLADVAPAGAVPSRALGSRPMTETALTVLALAVAFTSAGLAGLLALAEEDPSVAQALGDEAASGPGELPLRRAFHVARLALLIVAGVSAAQAIGWWIRAPLGAFWTAVVAATFLFLLADALPRMVASLAPELSTAVARAARRRVTGLSPLVTLVAGVGG